MIISSIFNKSITLALLPAMFIPITMLAETWNKLDPAIFYESRFQYEGPIVIGETDIFTNCKSLSNLLDKKVMRNFWLTGEGQVVPLNHKNDTKCGNFDAIEVIPLYESDVLVGVSIKALEPTAAGVKR